MRWSVPAAVVLAVLAGCLSPGPSANPPCGDGAFPCTLLPPRDCPWLDGCGIPEASSDVQVLVPPLVWTNVPVEVRARNEGPVAYSYVEASVLCDGFWLASGRQVWMGECFSDGVRIQGLEPGEERLLGTWTPSECRKATAGGFTTFCTDSSPLPAGPLHVRIRMCPPGLSALGDDDCPRFGPSILVSDPDAGEPAATAPPAGQDRCDDRFTGQFPARIRTQDGCRCPWAAGCGPPAANATFEFLPSASTLAPNATVSITVCNTTDRNTTYAMTAECAVDAWGADGRQLWTLCGHDAISTYTIAPGASEDRFFWRAVECLEGESTGFTLRCTQERPLAPGNYTLRRAFCEWADGCPPTLAGAAVTVA